MRALQRRRALAWQAAGGGGRARAALSGKGGRGVRQLCGRFEAAGPRERRAGAGAEARDDRP
eukprot:5442693-Prymnesium_polylepis.1